MRRRGFESHPVLSVVFDNSGSVLRAHDVAAAYRFAKADVRVRLPLGTSLRATGCGKAWRIRLVRDQETAGSNPAAPTWN
jgi:hypothetical protein